MDFKRIETIFLIVFTAINIFLGIEIYQMPTLLSSTHSTANNQSSLSSEIKEDNITVPKLSNDQGDGYYLAAKINNNWINLAKKEIASKNINLSSLESNSLYGKLNKPIEISKKSRSKKLEDVEKFKNNPKFVFEGKKYHYSKELSDSNSFIFVQNSKYGYIYSTRARLHISVSNSQIVSYVQRYADNIETIHERQATISSESAIYSLYTYSELPNDSKVIWMKNVYSRLTDVRGNMIFIPSWLVGIQNNTTKSVTIKRVNAFTGAIMQQNLSISEDKND